MNGSTFGKCLKMTSFGESHGKALGVVLDGFPAGMLLEEADLYPFLERRRPGKNRAQTARNEADCAEILSGVFEGKTTGTPIAILVENTSQISKDYDALRDVYRPSHADYGFSSKFGVRDHRGGGRSSGRETIARVAAGAVCMKLLGQMGVDVLAYTQAIGPVALPKDVVLPSDPGFDREEIAANETGFPNALCNEQALTYIDTCKKQKDSTGGVIRVIITGLPAGIGDPVFDKLDARYAAALMSVGAVKAVEIGDGVAVAKRTGSENNDFFLQGTTKERVVKETNRAGGIVGGISDGSPVILTAYVKPTASIGRTQKSIDTQGNAVELVIHGRHDPVIVPRAVVVAECMCAFVTLDAMLSHMSDRAEDVISFYSSGN